MFYYNIQLVWNCKFTVQLLKSLRKIIKPVVNEKKNPLWFFDSERLKFFLFYIHVRPSSYRQLWFPASNGGFDQSGGGLSNSINRTKDIQLIDYDRMHDAYGDRREFAT